MRLRFQIRDGTPFSLEIESNVIILAGPNGAGKSRLLHNLNMWNWASRGPGVPQALTTVFLDDHVLIPIMINSDVLANTNVRLGNLVTPQNPSSIDVNWAHVQGFFEADQNARDTIPVYKRISKFSSEERVAAYHTATAIEKNTFINALWLKTASSGLSHMQEKFVQYHRQYAALKYGGADAFRIIEILGEAPWIAVNKRFERVGLPYRILAPDIDSVLPDQFGFNLTQNSDSAIIVGDALSSGEKVILKLYDFLESHSDHQHILLIDDVDSLLHPPLLKILLSTFYEVLPERNSVAFIATHSPVTVQMCNGNDFYFKSDIEKIPQRIKKRELINKLSHNELVITDNVNTVFVEGQDHLILNPVLQRMIFHGIVSPVKSVIFVSPRTDPASGAAGKDAVNEIVSVLTNNGYAKLFSGLIDKDYGNKPVEGVRRLFRYSIENYWLDPLNIYCWMLDRRAAALPAALQFPKIIAGESRNLLNLLQKDDLQKIVDYFSLQIENQLKTTKPLEFSFVEREEQFILDFGPLSYPSFMLHGRGKTLLQAARVIDVQLNAKFLSDHWALGAFWPQELVDLMVDLSST